MIFPPSCIMMLMAFNFELTDWDGHSHFSLLAVEHYPLWDIRCRVLAYPKPSVLLETR
jgi:hypothetical protein